MTTPVWEMAVHLPVAGDVFDGVLFRDVFFPRDARVVHNCYRLAGYLQFFA